MVNIAMAGGGTGGHLVPGIALAERLAASGHRVHLVTLGRAVESAFLDGAPLVEHRVLRLEGRGPRLLFALASALWRSRSLLRELDADLVIGLGGRVTVPVALAARWLQIPICLLEQNAVCGRANRLVSRFAERIYLGFPGRKGAGLRARRVLHTGVPLAPRFLERAKAAGAPGSDRAKDQRASLGLRRDLFTVLVTGGSQGASVLNRVVPEALASFAGVLQVVHLTGTAREDEVGARYRSAGVHAAVMGFSRDMASLYEAADVVVCRGGAMTLCELMALGRAAVVIPYPWHRDGHQRHNAEAFAERGAATVVLQAELTPARLEGELASFLADEGRAARMGALARTLHRPAAAEEISEDVERLAEARP